MPASLPKVLISEDPIATLATIVDISIAFEVNHILDIERFSEVQVASHAERPVARPYIKDYDAIPENRPATWVDRFDTTAWGLLSARSAGRRIGSAVVAVETPDLLEGRHNLAVLWDLRIAPDWRRQGVGTALFQSVERWAMLRGQRHLRIETQHINLPACRLYQRMGCRLAAMARHAYPEFPDEVQLLWEKDLAPSRAELPKEDR
ncbi:MAG: GNAT family N-acetyltransferase [Gemmatimonadota bacterium]